MDIMIIYDIYIYVFCEWWIWTWYILSQSHERLLDTNTQGLWDHENHHMLIWYMALYRLFITRCFLCSHHHIIIGSCSHLDFFYQYHSRKLPSISICIVRWRIFSWSWRHDISEKISCPSLILIVLVRSGIHQLIDRIWIERNLEEMTDATFWCVSLEYTHIDQVQILFLYILNNIWYIMLIIFVFGCIFFFI